MHRDHKWFKPFRGYLKFQNKKKLTTKLNFIKISFSVQNFSYRKIIYNELV